MRDTAHVIWHLMYVTAVENSGYGWTSRWRTLQCTGFSLKPVEKVHDRPSSQEKRELFGKTGRGLAKRPIHTLAMTASSRGGRAVSALLKGMQ